MDSIQPANRNEWSPMAFGDQSMALERSDEPAADLLVGVVGNEEIKQQVKYKF